MRHAIARGAWIVAEWRLRINGADRGPVDDDTMRAMAARGEIKSSDLVWNPASKQWENAERLRGLFPTPAKPRSVGGGANGASGAAAAVADDYGPFRQVTLSFVLSNGKRWAGGAYASPHAFYLVKYEPARVHGAGGLLGAALQAAMEKFDDVRSCRLSELPEAVREACNIAGVKRDLDVIVIPKAAVSRVTFGFTGLKVTCGDDTFKMTPTIFTRGKTRRFITENGWQLDTDLMPTIAPVHGDGMGRSDAEPRPEPPSVWARLGYAAIAAIIMIAFVAWRASHGPASSYGR